MTDAIAFLQRERARMAAQIEQLNGWIAGIDLAIAALSDGRPAKPASPTPSKPVAEPLARKSRRRDGTAADKVFLAISRLGPGADGRIPTFAAIAARAGVKEGSMGYAISVLMERGDVIRAEQGGRILKGWPQPGAVVAKIAPAKDEPKKARKPQGEALLPAGAPIKAVSPDKVATSAAAHQLIDAFIAKNGVTKCPPAAVAPTQGVTQKPEDRAAIERHHEERKLASDQKRSRRWGHSY